MHAADTYHYDDALHCGRILTSLAFYPPIIASSAFLYACQALALEAEPERESFRWARPIGRLSPDTRADIREVAALWVSYQPNAHLGELTWREDLRSAFVQLRAQANRHGIRAAIGILASDAHRYSDM